MHCVNWHSLWKFLLKVHRTTRASGIGFHHLQQGHELITGSFHLKQQCPILLLECHYNLLQPTAWKFIATLKILNSWFRCVCLGLVLNSAEMWPSRIRIGHSCFWTTWGQVPRIRAQRSWLGLSPNWRQPKVISLTIWPKTQNLTFNIE